MCVCSCWNRLSFLSFYLPVVCIYLCIYMYDACMMCVCMCVCMYVCIYIRIYIYIYDWLETLPLSLSYLHFPIHEWNNWSNAFHLLWCDSSIREYAITGISSHRYNNYCFMYQLYVCMYVWLVWNFTTELFVLCLVYSLSRMEQF